MESQNKLEQSAHSRKRCFATEKHMDSSVHDRRTFGPPNSAGCKQVQVREYTGWILNYNLNTRTQNLFEFEELILLSRRREWLGLREKERSFFEHFTSGGVDQFRPALKFVFDKYAKQQKLPYQDANGYHHGAHPGELFVHLSW